MIEYDKDTSYYETRLKMVQDYPTYNNGSVCLNFGCGPMILKNWLNIDKYYKHEHVIEADVAEDDWMKAIGGSYDGYVDLVFSSHFLEHLPWHRAKKTLKNWSKVIKKGGKMVLIVPDLENTMKIMLDESMSFELRYEWYMLAMFGYQRSPDIPWSNRSLEDEVDPGQIHYCGFTKEWLKKYLTTIGFEIEEIWSYNGYDTPSLFCQAIKKD